jgi:peptidoglycan/LPS O-acetylase OafA/YrhL
MSTTFVSAYVLPSIAGTDPAYVRDVLAVATGGTATGDIGALATINQLQGFAYLAGGLVFGIALYRARVLARWAAALLAVGGVVSAALAVMPDAFYRLLAYPNGIAMIGLGYSLWSTARREVPAQPAEVGDRRATTTGGEATA